MKTIRIIVVIAVLVITFGVSAQLKVNSKGKVSVGKEFYETATGTLDNGLPVVANLPLDTCAMLSVYGKYNTRLGGGYINFGDNRNITTRYVGIGELGTSDTDKLRMFGRKGVYMTTLDNDTLCYYDTDKGDYFQFNCDVKTTGVFVTSDSRFKQDIEVIENAVEGLSMLSPVSYRLVIGENETASVIRQNSQM